MKEQIRQALEKSTQGPWEYHPGFYGRNHLVSQVETGNVVCMGKTFEKTESDFNLIANAPEWLRWQNERIEQLEKALEMNIELATLELDYEGSLRILKQIAAFSQIALGKEE